MKKCDECQRHAGMNHMLAENFHMISNPCPFAKWGLDIIGSLSKASTKHRFVLVATDYFTKWVEAVPLEKIGSREVVNFLCDYIIHRFGVPKVLMMDNGKQFNSQRMRGLCEKMKIQQIFSFRSYP